MCTRINKIRFYHICSQILKEKVLLQANENMPDVFKIDNAKQIEISFFVRLVIYIE